MALSFNGEVPEYGEGDVPPGTDYIAIAAGQYYNLALRSNGSIICWGDRDFCDTLPEGKYVAISAYEWTRYLALTSKGELVAWDSVLGWNHYVPPGTDFVAISSGQRRYAALRADGTVVCWPDCETCNISAFSNSIAISAVPSNFLAITNPRAKEILAVEWQKTKAHIQIQPGEEKDKSAKINRTPAYPVKYVIEATLPEIRDSVMAYCGKGSITGFFPNDLVKEAKDVPDTRPLQGIHDKVLG